MYGGSASSAVKGEFPEFAWPAWAFRRVAKDWWALLRTNFLSKDPVAEATVRSYLDDIGRDRGLPSLTNWLDLSTQPLGTLTHTIGPKYTYQLSSLGPLRQIMSILMPDQWQPDQLGDLSQRHFQTLQEVSHRNILYTLSYYDLIQVIGV